VGGYVLAGVEISGRGPEEQIKGEPISGMDGRRERSACCTPREKD